LERMGFDPDRPLYSGVKPGNHRVSSKIIGG
jgi:hypothetical protein